MTSVRSLGNRRAPISEETRLLLAELVRGSPSVENLAVHLASSRQTIEQALSPGALFLGATVARLEESIRTLWTRRRLAAELRSAPHTIPRVDASANRGRTENSPAST
jgi:hypothetical protein